MMHRDRPSVTAPSGRCSRVGVASRLAATVALSTVGLVAPTAPALAGSVTAQATTQDATTCDKTTFQQDFNAGGAITLCGDLTIALADNLPLDVAPGVPVALDLDGHTLDVTGSAGHAGIGVPAGASITIHDSSTAGTGQLTATAISNTSAGIGGEGGDAGSITISGSTVEATGGYFSAGIGGGGTGGGGGTVTIDGGTVTATSGIYGAGIGGANGGAGGTVTVRSGTVTATGRSVGAGIGGGAGTAFDQGDGADVTIEGGTVVATSTLGAGIGGGHRYSAASAGGSLTIASGASVTVSGADGMALGGSEELGTIVNSGTLTLPADFSIDLKGGTLTNNGILANGGTIGGAGTLAGDGTIHNAGAIAHTVDVGDEVTVTDHHYQLRFDTGGGTLDWDGAASWSIVDGPTLASVGRTVDQFPVASRAGHAFQGWNTRADGSGTTVADTTTFDGSSDDGSPVTITLYAQWTLVGVDRYVAVDGSNTLANTCLNPANPCRTIDYAVGRVFDATPFNPVETIHVGPGTYQEYVIVDPSSTTDLTIVGSGSTGPDATVIAGSSSSPDQTLWLRRGKSVTLKDLAVSGNPTGDGIVVYSSLTGNVTLDNVAVTGNGPGGAGDGIDIQARTRPITVTIDGSTIDGNGDRGIEIGAGPTTLAVTDSTISHNEDGIVLLGKESTARVTVDRSTIRGNGGYGAEADGGMFAISDSTITGNKVGVDVYRNGAMTVTGSTITGSTETGALAEGHGTLTLTDTDLTGNVGATAEIETAARLSVSGVVTVSGTIDGDGTLGGDGNLVNHGTIWHTVTVDRSAGLTIADHHYFVGFLLNDGTDRQTGVPFPVYAASPASAGLTDDDWPVATRAGYDFTGWYFDAEASGSPVSDTSELPGSSGDGNPVAVPLYAGWVEHAPTAWYAYPSGGAVSPTSCKQVTDLADACTLEQALGLADSGDTVVLESDPGAGTVATFTTTTGWDVPQPSLTIHPGPGVDAILDGDGVAPKVLDHTASGTLTVADLTVTNSVGSGGPSPGGGIVNRGGGGVVVTGVTFTGNTTSATGASGFTIGGGIVNASGTGAGPGKVVVTDSTFSDNDVFAGAGAMAAIGGGISNVSGGTVTVSGSTFDGNDTTNAGSGGAVGGAILNARFSSASTTGTLSVTASTFSRNTTTGSGQGTTVGGGILNDGTATVIASTLVGNDADGHGENDHGAAIVNLDPGVISIAATVVAGDGPGCVSASGLEVDPGAVIDAGYNVSSDSSCDFTASTSTPDNAQLAELLNPLGDNGGPTETIAPKPGSPAVGLIPSNTAVMLDGASVTLCPTTDQRGVDSLDGERCHAGSVQAVVGVPLAISTETLPDATVGTAYHQALSASGAPDGIYHWSIAAGSLPDGLALSDGGVISGIPTRTGTFTFTVSVNDPATAELSIVVRPAIDTSTTDPSPSTGGETAPTTDPADDGTSPTKAGAPGPSDGDPGPSEDGPGPSGGGPGPTTGSGSGSGDDGTASTGTDPSITTIPPTAPAPPTTGGLAETGVPAGLLPAALAALLLILAGVLLLAPTSRRRARQH